MPSPRDKFGVTAYKSLQPQTQPVTAWVQQCLAAPPKATIVYLGYVLGRSAEPWAPPQTLLFTPPPLQRLPCHTREKSGTERPHPGKKVRVPGGFPAYRQASHPGVKSSLGGHPDFLLASMGPSGFESSIAFRPCSVRPEGRQATLRLGRP